MKTVTRRSFLQLAGAVALAASLPAPVRKQVMAGGARLVDFSKPLETGKYVVVARFARPYQVMRELLSLAGVGDDQIDDGSMVAQVFEFTAPAEPYYLRGVKFRGAQPSGTWVYRITGESEIPAVPFGEPTFAAMTAG